VGIDTLLLAKGCKELLHSFRPEDAQQESGTKY